MIQVKKLVKTFEGFRALDGLDIKGLPAFVVLKEGK